MPNDKDPHQNMLDRVERHNNTVRDWDGWANQTTMALRKRGIMTNLSTWVTVKNLPELPTIAVVLQGQDAEQWLREHGVEPKAGGWKGK